MKHPPDRHIWLKCLQGVDLIYFLPDWKAKRLLNALRKTPSYSGRTYFREVPTYASVLLCVCVLYLCEPRPNTHTRTDVSDTPMLAIMHHTPLLQQSASAALRACAKRQRPGPEHAHSSTFIDLWPHQRCVSASLPNPLNLASDRQHAPRAAAEVCQSAWPLGGPQS